MNLVRSLYQHLPRTLFWSCRLTKANYEREMEFLDILCDPLGVSLDIGAKVGMYTYRLLKYSREVWAFEPIPELARLLRKAFGKQVHVEAVALSDQEGRLSLRIPFNEKGVPKYGRSTVAKENPLNFSDLKEIEVIEIETKTLDQYSFIDVGFIKIDVEGHELAVLKGAQEILKKHRPTLLIEANDQHHPGALEKLKAFLESQKYEGYFLFKERLMPIGEFDRKIHFEKHGIENFVFLSEIDQNKKKDLVKRLEGS
ncbi:MAG: FkbM family methyltransferase [bacterium]|nr:FkbM family methyltransferase [bacterium]